MRTSLRARGEPGRGLLGSGGRAPGVELRRGAQLSRGRAGPEPGALRSRAGTLRIAGAPRPNPWCPGDLRPRVRRSFDPHSRGWKRTARRGLHSSVYVPRRRRPALLPGVARPARSRGPFMGDLPTPSSTARRTIKQLGTASPTSPRGASRGPAMQARSCSRAGVVTSASCRLGRPAATLRHHDHGRCALGTQRTP